MRKIFIDLGGYDGDSLRAFLLGEVVDDPEGYEKYVFEPNPKYKNILKRVTDKYGATMMPRAAWIEDGTIKFAVDPHSECDLGSTAMSSKKVWQTGKIVEVESIDFSKWIEQFKGDFVVVKMDIEGAEFPVLEKMIADGSMAIVSHLFVEFHANKVPEYTTTHEHDLRSRISGLGVVIHEWK